MPHLTLRRKRKAVCSWSSRWTGGRPHGMKWHTDFQEQASCRQGVIPERHPPSLPVLLTLSAASHDLWPVDQRTTAWEKDRPSAPGSGGSLLIVWQFCLGPAPKLCWNSGCETKILFVLSHLSVLSTGWLFCTCFLSTKCIWISGCKANFSTMSLPFGSLRTPTPILWLSCVRGCGARRDWGPRSTGTVFLMGGFIRDTLRGGWSLPPTGSTPFNYKEETGF